MALIYQRQIHKQDAEKGKYQPGRALDALFAAHKAEHEQIQRAEHVNHHFAVLRIHARDGRIARDALHDNDLHTLGTARAEQVARSAGHLKRFSCAHTGRHLHAHVLFAHAGTVRLQVVLHNLGYNAFFKGLPLAGHQFGLIHHVDAHHKCGENHQQKQRRRPAEQQAAEGIAVGLQNRSLVSVRITQILRRKNPAENLKEGS